MQTVIPAIPRDLLKKELTRKAFLRPTNKAGNEIYILTAQTAPNVMRELGRLRELSYRAGGGGTGKDCDIDAFDTSEHPYHQLIVWDPENEAIVGGYRYLLGPEIPQNEAGQPQVASAQLSTKSSAASMRPVSW